MFSIGGPSKRHTNLDDGNRDLYVIAEAEDNEVSYDVQRRRTSLSVCKLMLDALSDSHFRVYIVFIASKPVANVEQFLALIGSEYILKTDEKYSFEVFVLRLQKSGDLFARL